jgi:VWFA-related protein
MNRKVGILCCAALLFSGAQQLHLRAAKPAPLHLSQDVPAAPSPAGDQAVFKSNTDLVLLRVNVFDGRSDAVAELPRSAFTVVEDGKPQEITFFEAGDVPVAVGLVVDNSGSMLTRRKMVVAGGTAFAESSHPDDEVFTIIFNENIRAGLPDSVAFTQSRPLLMASLMRFPSGGLTALYDAVIAGLDHLQEASLQKHVLVVLSDGDDNASQHSLQDMLHRAARSDALIYTIWTGDLTASPGKRDVLRKLANANGGVAYFPKSEERVVMAFKEIAENIRRGYSIGYVPINGARDGEYRRVKVGVRVPGRNLTVRVRDGYAAAGGESD